ncbi:MAG: NAD(P)-dependent oxidoreductase [Candidatus Aenigmatarchaeota archaeon]
MRIAFYEAREDEVEFFSKELKDFELYFFKEPLNENNLVDAEIISVFVDSRINSKILEKLKNVKFICTRSTGYDHIDIEECKKRGIVVSNVPAYGIETVAEHTIALILAISRRLFESFERTRKGNFSNKGLTGFELKGKTLGIIGAGKIGRRVAELAKAFGMRVIAYDIYPNFEEAKRIGYEYVDFDTLLKEADIISLHANLTKENYHLLNENAFEKMKNGIIIINTARGGLIDTKALIKYIGLGKVKYAALDVLENEPEIKEELEIFGKELSEEETKNILANYILFELEDQAKGVLITPHNAFNSIEALEEIKRITLENIISFIKGNPINVVSK